MTRPLSPAFFMSSALALVDDDTAVDAGPRGMSAALARRYRLPNGSTADAVPSAAANPIDGGWSAAFVHHVGYWSHFDYRTATSVWPLPATSSCTELAAFAASHFILSADAPESGDIYLLWSPQKMMFVRAGIVLGFIHPLGYLSGRKAYECLTLDGDTTPSGSLRGPYTAVVQRVLSPDAGDRLIRWPLLELISSERPWCVAAALRRAA